MIKRVSVFLSAAVSLFVSVWIVKAQQTCNYELRAVPSSKPVRIDGKLNDWDISGQILCCYDLASLEKTHSVRVAAMYDANYLYLAFHFKDETPLVNHIDSKIDSAAGWKADGVQIRIRSDRAMHITAWYYTDRNEPAMSIHYGMWDEKDPDFKELNDALAAGAQEAFLKDADGRGYVQEIALPWKLITRNGNGLKSGDRMQMGLELFWGSVKANDWPEHRYADLINPQRPQREFFWTTPEVWGTLVFLDHGNLEPSQTVKQLSDVERQVALLYQTEGPVPIRYEIPFDAGVTLVIEKQDGTRVKNLISDYPRKTGVNTDFWDGTDDNGHIVPAGEYQVRGLYHKDLDLLYDFAYGNPGNPPYDNSTGTGGWLSNHENPFAVAADDERIYFAAPQAEGATSVMAADYQGRRQWGVGNISAGMMARYGTNLYMLIGGYIYQPFVPHEQVQIVRINAATGKYVPWSDGKSSHTIATIPPIEKWWIPRRPEGELVEKHGFNADWCQRQTMGLAVAGNKLYASLYYENKIVVIDMEKGEAVGEIPLQHPAGLAGKQDGTLYAISGTQIVKIDGQGQSTPVVSNDLSAPVGLAIDGKGNLYVSDWGEAMCVKVFSSQGKLLKTIGRIGGRSLVGKYDPDGMFRPFGIAVDKQNRLWVAEFDVSPRRISVWDTASGKFLKEYCGSTYYAAEGARVNPLDPKEAFVLGNSCELDWKKGLWRVIGTPFRPTKSVDIPFVNPGSYNVVKYKGREFLIYNNGFLFCVLERNKKGDKPLAALGSIYGLFRNGEEWPDMILKKLTSNPKQLEDLKKRYPKAFNGMGPSYPEVAFMIGSSGVKANFVWIDQNGDGLVQETELQLFSNQDVGIKNQRGIFHTGGWGYAVGPDLSLYFPMTDQQDGVPTIKVFHLVIKEWNKAGAPVYDFQDMKVVGQEAVLGFGDSFQWVDSQGNVLVGHNPMIMISLDGKTIWQYPNPWPGVHGSHTAPAAKRGRIIGPLYVLGSAQVSRDVGEVFCLAGNLGERYLMTTDGLFLANLFADGRSAPDALPDEPRRGISINSSTAGGESFGGEFFRNPSNGKYYIGGPVGACREASIIAELTGLDSARRLPKQSLKFTEQQHTEALQFQSQQAIKQAASKALYITEVKQSVKEVPEWGAFDLNDRRVARWNFDPRHSASATWSYDENNLYIAFQSIRDDTPMINGGVDVITLFKTGDAVEFELRTQPDNNDAKIIEGDLRLVISVFQGKPVAVLYNYKVPGTTEPVPFNSPVGTVKIDKVVVLDRAKIAIDRGNGEYSVRASIRLSDIGFSPRIGATYRGDFGVVYSDKAGKIDELRMYWANPSNAMVNDMFSEAQINPVAWGRFKVEEKK